MRAFSEAQIDFYTGEMHADTFAVSTGRKVSVCA